MRRNGSFLVSVLLLGSATCSKSDPAVHEKLDKIISRLDDLEKKIDTGPRRPQPPRRPVVDQSAVYSVPIAGDPVNGPPTAKVTIVEASEFA